MVAVTVCKPGCIKDNVPVVFVDIAGDKAGIVVVTGVAFWAKNVTERGGVDCQPIFFTMAVTVTVTGCKGANLASSDDQLSAARAASVGAIQSPKVARLLLAV